MIEVNGEVLYRAIKMLNGINEEYRFKFEEDSKGFTVTGCDSSNVMMQSVDVDISTLTDYSDGPESGIEIGMYLDRIFPFIKANKKANWFRLEFETIENNDKQLFGKIIADSGASVCFKTVDLTILRKTPNLSGIEKNIGKTNGFTCKSSELKEQLKLIGAAKNDTIKFVSEKGKMCFKCKEMHSSSAILSQGDDTYCNFSYLYLNRFLKSQETKDKLRFGFSKDMIMSVVNETCGFTNRFIIAPRIENE